MFKSSKVWVVLIIAGIFIALPAIAGSHSESGYLADIDDYSEFTLYANSTDMDINFYYPNGADFWVTVYGMSGNELGDFQLSEGSTINLTGGGKFTLVVTSEYGGGSWECDWYDE